MIYIAVYPKDGGPGNEVALERELAEGLGYPVDLRILNASPLSFRFRVIKEGELLLSRNEAARVDFETSTFVLYHGVRGLPKD